MAAKTYDVIVVGVGAMGSAALHHLARRGSTVLGLEMFDIPNDQGSSHGVNRIFRLAYYEDPGYVPLMRRALELWLDLETRAGERLVHVTGSVDAGPADGDVFTGSLESCRVHHLDHEVLDGAALAARFPGYRLPRDTMSVFQPEGGFLLSERCIVAHVSTALAAGAEIHARESVEDWSVGTDGRIRVETDRGSYQTTRLVITAGAWTSRLVPGLDALAVPERQVLGWFQPRRPELFTPDRFPVFNLAVEEGRYYGFPVFGIPGFKIGRYHHLEEVTSPERVNRGIDDRDEQVLRAAIGRYFPDADGPTMTLKTCLFTNSPDEHFILDSVPQHPEVILAAGFSGHGFKFASAIGEVLADLARDGETNHDISMFALSRFL